MKRLLAAVTLLAVLASCAGAGGAPGVKGRIDRALAIAPGAGQPSKVVAAEIALEQLARAEGQWTAFRQHAASGAVIHELDGPFSAESWLSGRRDPVQTDRWNLRSVWMSCDGSLGVSKGRMRSANGEVGNFFRIWERVGQNGYSPNDYKWSYHFASIDDPQPAPPVSTTFAEEDADAIVVTAFDAIQGFVADCPVGGASAVSPVPPSAVAGGVQHGGGVSADGTLQWGWVHDTAGRRQILVKYIQDGEWKAAIDESIESTSESS